MNEESIFAVALEIASDAERQAYLDRACGDDAGLRANVEGLLKASGDAGSFLGRPAGAEPTVAATRADGDTHDSDGPSSSLPYLAPCDTPGRIGKLGHYEIIEVVGQGGMGSVLRAFDTKLVRIVAVKVMAPELAANPTAVKRFLREAQSAAAVHHDHVVTIHGVEEAHRPPYLVMQFVEGQTLEQKIQREGALDLRQILRIGGQMAAGLAAAHKHGLIHRDVKPGNILLENGVERVKITDFGLARAADDIEMTQPGMIAGTPQFMSPEQARGESIDMRSDLFSLGSVLYTMCTGRPAFRAETTMGVLKRVCEDAPRPIREVNPQIPPWLEAIVGKLLAKDPADRFQTAAEVADLLGQYLAHVQSPALVPQPVAVIAPPAAPPPPRQASIGLAKDGKFTPAAPVAVRKFPLVGVLLGLALAVCVALGFPLLIAGFFWAFGRPSLQVKQEIGGTAIAETSVADAPLVDLVQWGKFQDPSNKSQIEREMHRVTFTLPASHPYNLNPTRKDGLNAPRLLHDAEGDFIVRVAVLPFPKSQPGTSTAGVDTASWRSAGLLIQIDERSLLRFERVSWGERQNGAMQLHAEWFSNGRSLNDMYVSFPGHDDLPLWLQIERQGSVLRLLYNNDGLDWRQWALVTDFPLPARVLVGLVALHSTPTEFTPEFEDLRFQAADGGQLAGPRPVHRIPGWGAAWSPDSKLLVRHDSTVIEQAPTGSLEKFELATGVSTPLAPRGKDPSWSPVEGGPIAYVVEEANKQTVWICRPDGSERKPIAEGYFVCGWSTDGAQLYFYDAKKSLIQSIAWAEPAASPHTLATVTESISAYPAVSPDGRLVAFALRQPGEHSLIVREIATGATVATAAADSGALLFGWSPDSRRLAYGDYGYKNSGLWMLDLASGESRKVLEGNRTYPRWSPSGEFISVDARDSVEVLVYSAADLDPWRGGEAFGPAAAAQQQALGAQLGVDVEIANSLGMKLRLIPPGEFQLGSNQNELEDLIMRLHSSDDPEFLKKVAGEYPPRKVRSSEPFYMAAHEVTVGQFRAFVEAKSYLTDGERSGDGGFSGRQESGWVRHEQHVWKTPGEWPLADDQPVVHVSYNDAFAFCQWLSEKEEVRYFLPNELQWEFAARAGSTRLYGGSDDPNTLDKQGWYKYNQPIDRQNQPQPVGQRAANPFGLYDMLGNVWEWTDAWHRTLPDRRVLRGGAWYDEALAVRPASRGSARPDIAWDAGTGFRAARTVK